MDKETLSNYGWIVICVLVLAVMIALATPFGNFISTAVKSTTQGLFDTNKNALNSTGLINIGDQSFDDNASAPEIKREAGTLIPDGAIYIKNSSSPYGTRLEGNGTNVFPDTPVKDDAYIEGDYIYYYDHGKDYGTEWSVRARSATKTKTSCGEILSEIAGKPVTNMYKAFENCTKLTTAPAIPSNITDITYAFWGCKSLTTAPAIPNSITNMDSTFWDCKSLTTAPTIPSSVTEMSGTFWDCKSLTTAPIIPNSVTDMDHTFFGCTSLTTAPVIPNSVTDMGGTFQNCTSLTTAPVIPNSVENMSQTFQDCTSLATAPIIPDGVKYISQTFEGCTLLKGQTIVVPKSATYPGTSGTWTNGPSWIKK